MNDLPLVSIVTPSFNQGKYLEQTIQSVLNQDYPHIEYIVIDGGSNDESVEIIKKYNGRIAYWTSEPDRGQTDALIKGFKQATGSLLGWICSDDLLEPSMVSQSVSFHLANPTVGMTFGDRIRIDQKGNSTSFERYPAFRKWFLRLGFSIPQETVLLKRKIYEQAGGLDRELEMAMDTDLWLRVSRIAAIHHLPAFLGRFRTHAENKSSIFTNQFMTHGFRSGFPAEYALIYEKYFGSRPTKWKIIAGKAAQIFFAFLDRRTSAYSRETSLLADIRRERTLYRRADEKLDISIKRNHKRNEGGR